MYNLIVQAATDMKEEVVIPEDLRIDEDEFLLVDDCILNDYPELWYYWCKYW